ncbi:MAG: FAD-dependent oxidoreductase [Cyclobacteriaceae bacterium]
MLSYWERESFTEYDYAVIGGGITGLSTAISLKDKDPGARIVVLERGLRPTGASSRNAGFACFGSASELSADIKTLGEEGMVDLVHQRWSGLQKLRGRVGDKNLKFENYGGYELLRDSELMYLDKIDLLNGLLKDLFKGDVFRDHSNELKNFGFSKTVRGLIYNPFESQLHPGEMMRNLWLLASEKGIVIITGARVKRIEPTGNLIKIRVGGNRESDKMGINAGKIAVCTNGFTRQLFPDVKLRPGRGLVLVTEPVEDLPFRGTFHMDRGYYYFRNAGNRIIFGGGRNLQMKEEETTEFGINTFIKETLLGYLQNLILPSREVKIERFWSGIMAFGDNKAPIVECHSPGIYVGARLGGMGVAIGSNIGEKLAEMMIGDG